MAFDLDSNGILNVSALDKSTGKKCNTTISNEKGRLSKDAVEKAIADAEKFKEEDEKMRKKIEVKNDLESYVYACKKTASDDNDGHLSDDDKELVKKTASETLSWLDDNGDSLSTEDVYRGGTNLAFFEKK